ncbi:HNH endonuclease family protein [Treponema pedis]|uniref:HNH endonuclease family protein n=1 Tax=Treponema pedis TaxID=409322 RepID=UPI001CEFAD18|nr:HNH endonuclease family protein [Treponema pedis]
MEHISPQTPTDENETLESGYDVNSDNEYSEEFAEKYLNCIGNLLIISKSHNSSIGNKAFKEKLKSYNSNPLLNQQAEIKDFLIEEKIEWKKQSIDKRKQVIVNFVLNNWNFNNV